MDTYNLNKLIDIVKNANDIILDIYNNFDGNVIIKNDNSPLTVADQMAIMNHHGEIVQIGTPKEIYEFPKNSFVANFVGTTNIIHGILRNFDKEPVIEVPELGLFQIYIPTKKDWMRDGGKITMSIRPEKIFISKTPETEHFSNTLQGTVHSIVYHGRSTQYNILLSNHMMLQVFEQNEEHFPHEHIDYDDKVYLYWQKENVVLLEN